MYVIEWEHTALMSTPSTPTPNCSISFKFGALSRTLAVMRDMSGTATCASWIAFDNSSVVHSSTVKLSALPEITPVRASSLVLRKARRIICPQNSTCNRLLFAFARWWLDQTPVPDAKVQHRPRPQRQSPSTEGPALSLIVLFNLVLCAQQVNDGQWDIYGQVSVSRKSSAKCVVHDTNVLYLLVARQGHHQCRVYALGAIVIADSHRHTFSLFFGLEVV